MDDKDWKQYDPEHLKYIQTMIDNPYTDVPKQDVIFLMDRLKQSQHRERVLRDALEIIAHLHRTPIEKPSKNGEEMRWDGKSYTYDTEGEIAKEALEASK